MDPYGDFADRYDLSFNQFGQFDPETVGFFRQLFQRHQVQTVLDCACGTGRTLPLLYNLGCVVTGSDISEAMLAQAKANLAEVGLHIPLRQADFRHLPDYFSQPFDAIACLAAIGFMDSETDFLRAFRSMAQILRPGGLLVMTAMPTDKQWKEKPRFILNANTQDFSRLFIIDYMENKARYNILDVFHSSEKNDLKVWSAELHTLLQDDQAKLLKSAGFQDVDFYGSYDFTPYDKQTSNSLITVAFK